MLARPRALAATAVASLVTVLALVASTLAAAPAGAGVLALDALTAIRPILFPVAGPHSYADTFGACRSGCSRSHEGTDVMAPHMTPLVAVRDARVRVVKTDATPDGSSGNYVFLEDDDGWQYWYIHTNNDTPGTDDGANPPEWLMAPGVERGARVRAGQLISWVGDSGNAEATGHHLHFEIHNPDGEVVNPYLSLRAAPQLRAPLPAAEGPTPESAVVDALYEDFLGRAAGDVERAPKQAELVEGLPLGQLVARFAGSDEWVSALLDGYYRDTLGRSPDAAGKDFWTRTMQAGRPAATVAADFYGSAEYVSRAGGTHEAWLVDLYGAVLDRAPGAGELAGWLGRLAAGDTTGEVALGVFQSLESRERRVEALYERLLGRGTDAGGLAYWADLLADGQDLRLATFLASSEEYAARALARATEAAAQDDPPADEPDRDDRWWRRR